MIDGSEGEASKLGLHAGLGYEKNPVKDGFDFGSDRTFMVRREGAEAVVGGGFDGPVNIKKRDVLRCAGEGETPGGALFRGDQAGFDED